MPPNPFLLAADDPVALLALLREHPNIAADQDGHGYSLVHAAASYNHLDLLRALIREFQVDVNIRDEDDETPLFVVESVDAAKVLVEELGADLAAKGTEGCTAREKIEEEADFPQVAAYLRTKEPTSNGGQQTTTELPNLPDGLRVSMNAVDPDEVDQGEADPELRRRIEELAARDDFHTEAGQAELRQLVLEALSGGEGESRNVRARQE